MEFIDFHAHLHPTVEAKDRLIKKMDEVGIHRAVVVAGGIVSPELLANQIHSAEGASYPVPNLKIAELCASTRGRLLPFYFANPHEGAEEYGQFGDLFYGLKLGPAVHGVSLLDPRHADFLRIAESQHHPVYLHCLAKKGFDVASLVTLAQTHRNLSFVLGHAGIGNCDFSAIDQIAEVPNIYFETSGGFSTVISQAVKKLGLDRILFGTEYPLQAPEVELSKMHCLNLEPLALNRNASKILGGRYVW